MKAIVKRVALSIPLQLEEIDISTSQELEDRYGLEIPCCWLAGRKRRSTGCVRRNCAESWLEGRERLDRVLPFPPVLPFLPISP